MAPFRVLLLAASLVACSPGSERVEEAAAPAAPSERDARSSVVLVVIDTLRADHVGAYGYERNTTPHLDALAREATLYERAVATGPWTLPTHGSLFTGLLPTEHGAHNFEGIGDAPFNAVPLREDVPTLAGVLRERGFRTGAFLANPTLDLPWKLDRGFEQWTLRSRSARFVVAEALRWVDEDPARPFFLFLNFMDCHHPVNLSTQFAAFELEEPPGFERVFDRLVQHLFEGREPAAALRRRVVDQYDVGIANADHGLGVLLAGLEERGRLAETLLVVTSDHGEFFGEHGLIEHGTEVYEEVLRVPLVVRAPLQSESRRVAEALSLAAVPRIVLDIVDPDADEGPFPEAQPVIGEAHYASKAQLEHWPHLDRIRTAYYDAERKLVHSSDGAHELYDLASDPSEERDLAGAESHTMDELLGELEARRAALEAPERGTVPSFSEEQLKQLEALGYR